MLHKNCDEAISYFVSRSFEKAQIDIHQGRPRFIAGNMDLPSPYENCGKHWVGPGTFYTLKDRKFPYYVGFMKKESDRTNANRSTHVSQRRTAHQAGKTEHKPQDHDTNY